MERKVNIESVKELFKGNFIGPKELKSISRKIELDIPGKLPEIPYSWKELSQKKGEYLLFLSVPQLKNGIKISILSLKELFGHDPDKSEPCFYNQDWYLKEEFVKIELELKWNLIRKKVIEKTRAVDPKEIEMNISFPSAVTSTYAFFIYKLVYNITLWQHEFIWCSDRDHNQDRIYVGKYTDVDGVNKNGFSIHRHLALRNCYASIDAL